MKIIKEPRVIVSNPDSTVFNYFAWPSIAKLNDGTLAVVCSGYRIAHVCPFGKAVISYSRDGGQTWSRPTPIIDTPLDDRDAGILVTKDKVIVTSFNNNVELQLRFLNMYKRKSINLKREQLVREYLKYITPEIEEEYCSATFAISEDGGYTFSRVKKAPITSPHGPLQTNDGRILWIGRTFSATDEMAASIKCCELNDNNEFVEISEVPLYSDGRGPINCCEVHAICLPSGRILVASRIERTGENKLFSVSTCYSDDGGKTFTSQKQILPNEAGSPPHLMLHSSGKLILSYATRTGDNMGIKVVISDDYGMSFGEEITLAGKIPHADIGYPASIELDDGSIATVYYENNGNNAEIKMLTWKI